MTWSRRWISAADDLHVLERARHLGRGSVLAGGARAGARRRGAGADRAGQREQLLLQQLEVDRHRVQRVLHLVRDARRQPPERHQLPRVVEHRLHAAEHLDVARDQHHADQLSDRGP